MKELIKHIRKVELDPNKHYLIFLDKKYFSEEMTKNISSSLNRFGFKCLIGAVSSLNGIKIVETKE